MSKKILSIVVIAIIVVSSLIVFSPNIASAVTADPSKLKIYIAPTKVPADNSAYNCIFVQLQDSSGKPARATKDVTISLSSSRTNIGIVESPINIKTGETFGSAKFNSTSTPGTTSISAASTGYTTVQGTITTTTLGSASSKLALFITPSSLPADNADYYVLQVQLQDSQGRPTKASEDITINMFYSQPSVGSTSSLLSIPSGKTQLTGFFFVKNTPGTTTVTAQASNLSVAQATITTYLIDLSNLKTTVTSEKEQILNGNKTEVTAYITVGGTPITGATVKFTSNKGGTFSTPKAKGEGYYTSTFTAPSFANRTNCTITASSSKTGYLSSQGTTQITVGPTLINNGNGSIQFCIKDEVGRALSGTVVSTTVQPSGMGTLFDLANSTGYVTFKNIATGTYTFRAIKEGYQEINATINYKGQPLTLTLTLSNGGSIDNKTLTIIAGVVITATVVAVISGLYIVKRRRTAKIRKLQDLQKHLKYKY